MFELRGAANGGTVSHFMHMWNVLADAAMSDADRDRAVRRRSEWALVDVGTAATDGVAAPEAWPCDVRAMTDAQVRDSFGSTWEAPGFAA